ncbi:hypothetical protein N0V90_001709 [Kalmusia sp. IMI 367209]|nr:hypothetical protein N0V90_001709 [Kalmusia sp. IMI 367209]
MEFLTSHPGKAVWVLGVVLITLAKLPLVSLYYVFRRPNPNWTIRQALMNKLMRAFLYHSAVVQAKAPLKLEPGSEGERFVTIPAVQSNHLKGVLDDKKTRPATTGGTWYPSLPPKGYTGKVILHFHGGGYAIGEGRAADAAYAGKTLTDNVAPYAIFVQYRLASNNGGRFPAALQDALSSYIVSFPKDTMPRTSPSINLQAARDPSVTDYSTYYTTDYLIGNFQSWGAKKLTESLELSDRNLRPYIVQLGHPFRSVSPVWVCVGGLEILGPDGIRIAEELREHGNVVETHTISGAPHDVMFVGNIMGFENKAVDATKVARHFIEKTA